MANTKGQPLQFDLDDDDLKLFCEEADEQIELLDSSVVQLEGEPDPELLQQIFRAAHTLKGSSATIGHKKMASLTHAMETVLDAVRQGRLAATADVVDALLAALDALRVLAGEVVTRRDSGTHTERLEAGLLATLQAGPPHARVVAAWPVPALTELQLRETLFAMDDGKVVVYAIELSIETSCQLPSIRCYQALQELDAIGSIFAIWPDRETVEAGGSDLSLAAVIGANASEEQVHSALLSISDVAHVSVRQLTPSDLEAPLAPVTPATPSAEPARLEVVQDLQRSPDVPRGPAAKKAGQSVRIDVERLDGLMNLVGELVIDRTRLQQIREQLSAVLRDANLTELTENFEETTSHLARVTDELQEEIMRSRMLPVRSVLTRLPRLVRDVAAKCGKKVELFTAGEETELDRSVIEEISDPLVHILRNAVDHGIESPEERRAAGKPETGTVTVTAWNQETYIYLSVKDDGKGIDTRTLRDKAVEKGLVSREAAEAATEEQAIQYVFFAGLSTAQQVSDVSGRGVGMDIVRTNIERLNGQITVHSALGKGSEVIIQLPLTLATTRALMVQSNETVYAIPLVSVTEALADHDAEIHSVNGRRTLRLRSRLLPVVELAHALGDRSPRRIDSGRFVVAARHGERQVAFIVDRLLGEQDVVVKSLGDVIGNRKGLTGATILGDGSLGLIIDTASLVSEHARLAVSA